MEVGNDANVAPPFLIFMITTLYNSGGNHMFLDNKYTKWYYQIIDHAKSTKRTGYLESHHIIPKSLGGSDAADNKVKLTAREHFVTHKLLIKMTRGRNRCKMSFAYHLFFLNNQKHQGRTSLAFTSREYAKKKLLLSEALSKLHKGKTVSQAAIEKAKATRRLNNKPYPQSARSFHRRNTTKRWRDDYENMVACHRTKTVKEKISQANKGQMRHSDEGRLEISRRNSGSGNGRAKHIIVTSPDGTIHHCLGNFKSFCQERKLPFSSMCHILHGTRTFNKGATVGWNAEYAK